MAKHSRPNSFTIVEMLTVIAIIAVLLGLLLAAMSGVMRTSGRDRARAEIKTLESALESYKADNGSYPIPPSTLAAFNTTNDYTTASPTSVNGQYQTSSAFLYEQLTGRTYFSDPVVVKNAATGQNQVVYYPFKASQLGNDTQGSANPIYIRDPFGNSYGYFAGSGSGSGYNPPFNGTNQYDLWSTGGDTSVPSINMPAWINNWGS